MNNLHIEFLKKAMTLIELIVVIAIISILVLAASVSNQFAVTRSKTARVKSDIKNLCGALEAYRIDNHSYPFAAIGDYMLAEPLIPLTSPVSYISSIPKDPFGKASLDLNPYITMEGYNYKDKKTTSIGMPGETYGHIWRTLSDKEYFLHSCGPNRIWDISNYVEYDPTNGIISKGDITVFGPM